MEGDPSFTQLNRDLGTLPAGNLSAAFTCNHCNFMSIGMITYQPQIRQDAGEYLASSKNIYWIPPKAVGREFPDVPEQIAAAASEAYQCANIGAHRGPIMLARAVIEATAKYKGVTGRNLEVKIDAMVTGELIPKRIARAAHEVRHFGNDMAHGDFIDDVTEEETTLALTLMDGFLDEVFQAPARIEQAEAARAVRDTAIKAARAAAAAQ